MATEEVIAGEASVREIPTPTPFNYRLFALPEKNGSDWEAVKTHPRKSSCTKSPRNPNIPYSPPYNGGDRENVVFQWFWLSRGDGSGARCDRPPRHYPHKLVHDIEFTDHGFFVDAKNFRWLDDPANEDFLMSLKNLELPKEFECHDEKAWFHKMIIRKGTFFSKLVPLSERRGSRSTIETPAASGKATIGTMEQMPTKRWL